MADLSATTKIETLMITVCWTEFHIKGILMETDKDKVTKDKVINVANLARLEIDDNSLSNFCSHFEKITEYIDILSKVDTEGVTPTFNTITLSNVLRDDILKESVSNKEALLNAPEQDAGYFTVPKIL